MKETKINCSSRELVISYRCMDSSPDLCSGFEKGQKQKCLFYNRGKCTNQKMWLKEDAIEAKIKQIEGISHEVRENNKIFCKDCKFFIKAIGAMCDEHLMESKCGNSGEWNYVIGKKINLLCQDVNPDGNCKQFVAKEPKKNNIPVSFVEEGLQLAKGSSLFGVKLEDMSREELMAMAAKAWDTYNKPFFQ